MKMDLEVIGQGAVTPAGIGVKALLTGTPTPTSVCSLGHRGKAWPVFRVELADPALVRWQKEPRLRRASPITYFLIEAAGQALAGIANSERDDTGLIVAFSAGCLVYSRRFYEEIVANGPKRASPALFPETVFNSPVSHIASVLGLNGAAYALVGDETAWITALKTASVWLKRKRVRQVLVLGTEEFDSLVLDAYFAAGWLRRCKPGFVASEGAAAVLVRSASEGAGVLPVIARAHDGFIYRTRAELASAAERLAQTLDPLLPFYPTAHHNQLASLELGAMKFRHALGTTGASYLGEALTASAAWNTLRGMAELRRDQPALALPVWGLNHQIGALELEMRI